MGKLNIASYGVVILLMLVCANSTHAQTDSAKQVDRIHLRDGSVLEGKVKTIKPDIVEFVERETNLAYEIKKSEIKVIVLSSGKTITFSDEPAPKKEPPPQQIQQPVIIEKESGSDTGLVIAATVGVVLVLLRIIGAASQ